MVNEQFINELSEDLIKNYQDFELYYITELGKDIHEVLNDKEINNLSKSQIDDKVIVMAGLFIAKMATKGTELEKYTKTNVSSIYTKLASTMWSDSKYLAEATSQKFASYSTQKTLTNLVSSNAITTTNALKNLSNTSMLGTYVKLSPGADKIFVNTQQAYISAIDKAVESITGGTSVQKALTTTLKSLGSNGLKEVYYNNGKPYAVRLDTAVRRNIQDGMRAVAQETQNYIGEQFGANGKELSVHMACAEDHMAIQGLQFTNEQYEEMNAGLERQIGTCNCRHYAFSIILGVSTPAFTQQQIEGINKINTDGWVDDNNILNSRTENKQYTIYEATQEMRKIESATRSLKYEKLLVQQTDDKAALSSINSSIKAQTTKYKALTNELEPYGVRADWNRFAI